MSLDLLLWLPSARDDAKAKLKQYSSYLADSKGCASAVEQAVAKSNATLDRGYTTEFENWIARICLGAGGTKPRDAQRSLESKRDSYLVKCEMRVDPTTQVHPALWKIASQMLSKDGKKTAASSGSKNAKKEVKT
jgi:hypothetical protein